MNRSASRLLSILLIFLLGLSPVQLVIANVSVPADHVNMPCHQNSDSTQGDIMSEQSTGDCDQCETASSCKSHCMSSILGLLVEFVPTSEFDSQALMSRTNVDVKTLQPPALYRPPRS